jgi:hypothetical protein
MAAGALVLCRPVATAALTASADAMSADRCESLLPAPARLRLRRDCQPVDHARDRLGVARNLLRLLLARFRLDRS